MIIKSRLYHRWWFNKSQADQAEAWLADLSVEGWQLEDVGLMFARFIRKDEALLSYLIMGEPNGPYQNELDMKDAFARAGWRLVCSHEAMLIFAAPIGTAPPGAYLREEIEKRDPVRKYRKELITLLIVLPASGGLFALGMSQSGTMAGALQFNKLPIILSAGFFVYGASECIWLTRKLMLALKQRKEDIPYEDPQLYKRTIRQARIACIIPIIYHCVLLAAAILGITLGNT